MRSFGMSSGLSFVDTGIMSVAPLVSFTKRHTPTPIGLAGACPQLFEGRKSLHLVAPCWNYYPSDIEEIASEWHRARTRLPDATIVFLASTEREAVELSLAGVPTLPCNVSILVDETIYKPMPALDFSDAAYDAIYNARFEPYKRHELARRVNKLALIHDARFDGSASPHEAEVRRTLPGARYINHEYGDGAYASLDKSTIARQINQARCGLCLSSDEGVMKASIEYLMCGVPVVSTHSVGGRYRYYQEPYALVVPDDPHQVADAVAEIGKRKFNKLAIRDHVGKLIEFERRNFLTAVNALAFDQFGVRRLFSSLAPFMQCNSFTEPQSEWSRQRLIPLANLLGVELPPLVTRQQQ
jgi:glycosyltransferase involved in cell wall biosynthesis